MNPLVESAFISAAATLFGVGGTVAVAVVGFRSSRSANQASIGAAKATTDKTLEAASATNQATIEAAHADVRHTLEGLPRLWLTRRVVVQAASAALV
jgi:cell division septum initiation protein DivIVA